MKYDHVVKVNGVFYAAGQEVPTNKAERAEGKMPSVSAEKAEAPVERKPVRSQEKKDR